MMMRNDFLIEIHTEELPPKSLLKLAESFSQKIKEALQKTGLEFTGIDYFATPRRLAVLVHELTAAQRDQWHERKGPALQAAFDAAGNPTQACIGFARSCGITPAALVTIKNDQGEWVGHKQNVPGKSVAELLPTIIEQAAINLPIQKRMRWGDSDVQFVRPVHSVIMLYGDQVIAANILGRVAGRQTRGHRFHAPHWISVPHAAAYAEVLLNEGKVIADFAVRRKEIIDQAGAIVQKNLGEQAKIYIDSDDFLNEVTGLVEWPVALSGRFDKAFLSLPPEILMSAMQDHQRYFPVIDAKKNLMSYFITISNIESSHPPQVVHGNERVLQARLADAAFFYQADGEALKERIEKLKGIVFQAKLGTLHDKALRLGELTAFIAGRINCGCEEAKMAGILAKTDLTTHLVNEFPELQGVIGYYYARRDRESNDLAEAMREQYLPRFAGDELPKNPLGQALALADRIDTLIGTFGLGHVPSGDKDPYGLRRAALGVLRILIENELSLDIKETLQYAFSLYGHQQITLGNPETVSQLLNFIQERLRVWYQEQGVSADVFAAVAARGMTDPIDMHARIHAVQAFKKLTEAAALCIANKRVSHILAKYIETMDANVIDPSLFEEAAEAALAKQLAIKKEVLAPLYRSGEYAKILLQLAELHQPVDDFFNQVMVMTEDKKRRENRILLLGQLRALFLQVADIALLQ